VGLDNDDIGVEEEVGVDQGDGVKPEDGVDQEVGVKAVVGEDEEGKDGDDSEISRSDVLISHRGSDEEVVAEAESSERPYVTKRMPFGKEDMGNLILELGNTFENVYQFRKVVKQASVLKVKDLTYQENSKMKFMVVCADNNCNYRVYGRQLKDE
jgi:hypothetical protein